MTSHIKSHHKKNGEPQLDSWNRCVMDITAIQLHSTMPELRFCVGSNPTRSMTKIYDRKNYNDPGWKQNLTYVDVQNYH